MAKSKPPKKRVVTTSKKEPLKPTVSRSTSSGLLGNKGDELIFKRSNYIWMLAGIILIGLGMLLMVGGDMPSEDVWDEDIIYSFRRTTLAPIIILAGLVVEVVAIFRK